MVSLVDDCLLRRYRMRSFLFGLFCLIGFLLSFNKVSLSWFLIPWWQLAALGIVSGFVIALGAFSLMVFDVADYVACGLGAGTVIGLSYTAALAALAEDYSYWQWLGVNGSLLGSLACGICLFFFGLVALMVWSLGE